MYADPPSAPDVEALHAALFRGAILRFAALPEMAVIAAFSRDFATDRLAPYAPTEIHRHFPPQTLAERLANVQRAYSNDPEAKRLWRALFEAVGFDPADTMRDRLILRFQPPVQADGTAHRARSTATVGFHRDSWGTNLYAQVNWWAPVFPITAGRTFAFLPGLFDRPLANDSADFDLAALMAHNRAAGSGSPAPKPMTPRPSGPVDLSDAVPVVLAPGEIIAFSAQHAHVGMPNHTDLTRISLDTRTLRLSDQRGGRGARNVDGRAPWMALGFFRRLSDGRPLTELLGTEELEPFEGVPG